MIFLIARAMSSKIAGGRGAAYADVRSAVELSDDQVARLEKALSDKVGRPVTARITIDPSVVGGPFNNCCRRRKCNSA